MAEYDKITEQFPLERHDTERAVVFSGKPNDYYTVIEFEKFAGQNYFLLKVGANLTEQEMESDRFQSFTNEIKDRISPQMLEYRRNIFAVGGFSQDSFEEIESRVLHLLQFITEKFKSFGIKTGDFFNGHDDRTVELYIIADSHFLLSQRSYKERKMENEKAAAQTGIGSAFKGALLGSIISIFLCLYFYSFSLPFYESNFGWVMGSIIAISAYSNHRKNKEFVSIKNVVNVLGLILVFLLFSISSVMILDMMATRAFTFMLALDTLLFDPYSNFPYSGMFNIFLVGALFATISAFLYYKRYNKISKEVLEIKKVGSV